MVGRNSLPRSLSLKSRVEISRLLRNGKQFPTDFFILYWEPADQFACGVLVSRRLGPAHRRNRIKRLYREAIRLSRNQLTITGRLAIIPRARATEPKLELLIADVSRIFDKLSRTQ